jgi:beta-galactosidase
LRFLIFLGIALSAVAQEPDEFLHKLYDARHDTPAQRRFRDTAPMPFGVVFLPWDGMTEQELREQYRTMKRLGFHNLKQVDTSPAWSRERLLEIALEEDVIPFWYADAGWEPVNPALLTKLGLPASMPKREWRTHPKMLAYQKEVLRKQIYVDSKNFLGETGSYEHTPDELLRASDVPRFRAWLRKNYKSVEDLNRAWNLYEVNHVPAPFKTWEDVDKGVDFVFRQPTETRSWGREFGRIRDIYRYKAQSRVEVIEESMADTIRQNPLVPTRTGGEMGLFLPFAARATHMGWIADRVATYGSFYPSIHFVWHFGEVHYEVTRPLYMQVSFAADHFKGGWAGAWESSGGPQQITGGKGWDEPERSTIPGFTVNAGTITQQFLSYLAGGFKGAGVWTWNYRRAGVEAGEYALLERTMKPGARAIRAGQIAQAAQRLRDELWEARKEPYVGVLYNWDSDAIWAATAVRSRTLFKHYPMQARVGVSRALINGNIPWEYVTPDDLRAGLAGRYKTIYLPAQFALTQELVALLTKYAEAGGRVVIDAPGGWYDESGRVFPVAQGSPFEKLFGAEVAEFYYSNNVPRSLDGDRMKGFVYELRPTKAQVLERFHTGEPALTQHRVGKGSAVILAYDASFASFLPGNTRMEERIQKAVRDGWDLPYTCDGAIVYRLAAPAADHYFVMNDGEAREASIGFRRWKYRALSDAVTGEKLDLQRPFALEAHSGRWLRAEK